MKRRQFGKTLRKLISVSIVLGMVFLFGLITVSASSPNWASSTEHWSQAYYDGYIQCQPSYIENGKHAAQGWFVYRNGRDGEKWAYTQLGYGSSDSRILSASMRYYDTMDWGAPQVTFNYNFLWVPVGAEWPQQIPHPVR